MDFDKVVAAFTRKKNGKNLADERREQYRQMLKEYQSLKYGSTVNGVRKERDVTSEAIERTAQAKKETSVEIADDLAAYFDIDLDLGAPGDLEIGGPKQ